MQFLSTDAFDNKGIATFRHASLLSKKLRFKGADETEVGYAIYVPPAYENSSARYPILYFLAGNGGNENGVWHVVVKAHELIGKGELPPFIIVGVTGGRSFYGNVLFSTGPNGELGGTNTTLCHVDVPMRNCTLYLDERPIVVDGDIVVDELKAERPVGV